MKTLKTIWKKGKNHLFTYIIYFWNNCCDMHVSIYKIICIIDFIWKLFDILKFFDVQIEFNQICVYKHRFVICFVKQSDRSNDLTNDFKKKLFICNWTKLVALVFRKAFAHFHIHCHYPSLCSPRRFNQCNWLGIWLRTVRMV